MARKEPYRTIDVRRRILDALEPLRKKESEGELRGYSVNAFCEKILWDYAQGKLRKFPEGEAGKPRMVVADVPPSPVRPKRIGGDGEGQGRSKAG